VIQKQQGWADSEGVQEKTFVVVKTREYQYNGIIGAAAENAAQA
jgi:hypothetical protein